MSTTDFSPTVNFTIPADTAQMVVIFLLSSKISFRLMFSNYSQSAPIVSEEKEHQSIDKSEQEEGSNLMRTVIESIYQKYIEGGIEHVRPNESEIIHEFGITATLFKNGFKARYGKLFYQLYLEHKMAYAAKLLEQGHSASTISERIGYSHPIKFNKMFQKHFGMTPKKYQMERIK